MSNAAIQRMVEREFFIVYDDVIRDIKDPVAIALYCDLLSYASTNSTGSPSLRQLASDIGFSTKNLDSIRRALMILQDKGYIAVFNRWRDNEGNTSMSRSERFCIPTTNGYEVCTDLGGFKNHA